MKTHLNHIQKRFAKNQPISTSDLYEFYKSREPELKKSTINWRVYKLVKDGGLQRIGKGRFFLGSTQFYRMAISTKESKISKTIRKQFPFIKYCIWNTSLLNEFLQHQLSLQLMLVEVEQDALESISYFLQERMRNTFKEPTRYVMEEIVGNSKNATVLSPLITEAPIQVINNVPTPTIEKLLVDIYCAKTQFYFLQGHELLTVFRNAFDNYTINTNKLLRYARRRKKEQQIGELIQSITEKPKT